VRGTSRKKGHTSDQGASKARNKEKARKHITWARKKKKSLNPIAIGAIPSSFFFLVGFRTEGHDKDPQPNSSSSNTLENTYRLLASVWVCRSLAWRNVEGRVRWATVVDVVLVVVHDLAVADLVVVVAAALAVADLVVVVAAAPSLESGSFWDLGLVELGLAIHDGLPGASAIIAGGEVQLLQTDWPRHLLFCQHCQPLQQHHAATTSYELRELESLRVWMAREEAPWYRDLRLWLATEDATLKMLESKATQPTSPWAKMDTDKIYIYIYIQERTLKRKRCLGKLYQRDPN
jgi:hypothetical protein